MKVIVLKKFGKFTNEGSIVDVKDGYARNFLIPNGFAIEATEENIKRIEQIQKTRQKLQEKQKQKMLELKEKLEKISLTIPAQVKDADSIYGSISEVQILKALKEEGFDLEKDQITLEEPIKKIGVYYVSVILAADIVAKLRVWVVKK